MMVKRTPFLDERVGFFMLIPIKYMKAAKYSRLFRSPPTGNMELKVAARSFVPVDL
jgi:hypothetical protein